MFDNGEYSGAGARCQDGSALLPCRRVLLDTGQGTALAGNAFKLDVPLHEADAVILGHGHYDHSGGLVDVLRVNRPYIFAHPAALEPKFARNQDGTSREIGIPQPCERAIRQRSGSWVATTSPTPVLGDLMVTGPVPRVTDFEDTGGPFFLDAACSGPDPLVDDQAVFFETRSGIVILLSCAHSGVINTLQYVNQLTGGSRSTRSWAGCTWSKPRRNDWHGRSSRCDLGTSTAAGFPEVKPQVRRWSMQLLSVQPGGAEKNRHAGEEEMRFRTRGFISLLLALSFLVAVEGEGTTIADLAERNDMVPSQIYAVVTKRFPDAAAGIPAGGGGGRGMGMGRGRWLEAETAPSASAKEAPPEFEHPAPPAAAEKPAHEPGHGT